MPTDATGVSEKPWLAAVKRAGIVGTVLTVLIGGTFRGFAVTLGPVSQKTEAAMTEAKEAKAAAAANDTHLAQHISDEQARNAQVDMRAVRSEQQALHLERHLIRIEGALRIKPDPDAAQGDTLP